MGNQTVAVAAIAVAPLAAARKKPIRVKRLSAVEAVVIYLGKNPTRVTRVLAMYSH
jgi:hypothetical protein